MPKLFWIIFFFSTIPVFGQEKEYYRNTILYGHADYIRTEHYNSPKWHPIRETKGLVLGASTDLIAQPYFKLDLKSGYRYVAKYANPQAIISFQSDSLADSVYFDYHGGWLGLGFNIGRRHIWENSLIIGGGIIKKPRFLHSAGELELGLQSGYKYIAPQGYVIRVGIGTNFARNVFFSSMYSAYAGIGYAFQKSQGTIPNKTEREKEKGKHYMNLTVSGYIGSITLDFAGVNFRLDHLVYNGPYVDLGYGLSYRVGLEYEGDPGYSASASFIGLFGRHSSKLEFSIGPNFPFEEINSNYLSWYETIHLGVGYRFVPERGPVTLRVGSSTTSIVHCGVGIRFLN